jgi:hypothetical protein
MIVELGTYSHPREVGFDGWAVFDRSIVFERDKLTSYLTGGNASRAPVPLLMAYMFSQHVFSPSLPPVRDGIWNTPPRASS